MKRIVLLLALLPLVSTLGAETFHRRDPNPVNIIRKNNPPTPKSPEIIPVQVYVDADEMLLTASASVSGSISVEIENLATGALIQDSFISSYSQFISASGWYRITFTLSDGSEYYGDFVL